MANSVASTTLSTSAWLALPLEEWDSIATFGSLPVSSLKLSAEEHSNGCQLFRIWILVQSAVSKYKGSIVSKLAVWHFH